MDNLSSTDDSKDTPFDEEEIDDIRTDGFVKSDVNTLEMESSEQEYIDLKYNSEAFTEDEAEIFLRKAKPVIVSIVGDSGSGKSSLIQCIYELFQKGNITDKKFNSSHTLIGLDRRSHFSRLNSKSSAQTISRTSIGEGVQHFHFCVTDDNKKYHVLISDRAGESYSLCRDNPEIANEYMELIICDIIIILLDGEKIINPVQRTKAINSVQKTVMLLCDSLRRETKFSISIVVSKFDLIESYLERDKLEEKLNGLFKTMATYALNNGIIVSQNRISVHSSNSKIQHGHGVKDLFIDWCEHDQNDTLELEMKSWSGSIRQIDKLN